MSKYTTPAARVAELVAKHGSYRKAAKALNTLPGSLHHIATGLKLPRRDLLERIGLDPDSAIYKRLTP